MEIRETGKAAYFARQPLGSCPYPRLSREWWLWIEGYIWARTHYPFYIYRRGWGGRFYRLRFEGTASIR